MPYLVHYIVTPRSAPLHYITNEPHSIFTIPNQARRAHHSHSLGLCSLADVFVRPDYFGADSGWVEMIGAVFMELCLIDLNESVVVWKWHLLESAC